ncbi:MAG TPA: phosphatase PAP2 family protein [Nocardioides sp.]|uniref:phosphatase PAP2 family protein n=1 Tax=uncultured Nocardioides sp. TaxID=198441 RepID=UPI0026147BB7|nr:phosphatase PAP2 family protein [uncultured Nocardioides sp.]HRD60375.1 phosphatase PAP2 family protein [Nocardioides sp.]HRI95082.1 phosphatase PAP2 family protein [Nocardioides sp.]
MRRVAPTVLRAVLELALVFVLFELYRFGRLLARGQEAAAYENAVRVHHLEQVLRLPSEATIQGLLPDSVLHLANVYYVSVHFPAMIAFLVWGYLFRPRAEYRWARNLVISLTGIALVVHIVFPLAPPRMFPQWGFLDTMAAFGPDAYAGASGDLANQFAAMPSLHVGWAVLIAYVVHRTGPRWLAWVAYAHVLVTVTVVVVTANHYWLDGVVAVLLLTAVAVALPPPAADRPASTTPSEGGAVDDEAVLRLAREDR